MCAHIVLVEDDRKQADLVRRYLERDEHSVATVSYGFAAIDEMRSRWPDLLVLDRILPDVDGLEVCRAVRRASNLPVLMLTARTAENDLLAGLDSGADDYLTKPFSPRELAARVRALLRRSRCAAAAQDPVARVGSLVVDSLRHCVTDDGRPVPCTPGEFRLLETLAAQPGRVFTREQLVACLHGFERGVTLRAVDMHVMNLRRKIEEQPRRPARLVTVYGIGYKLAGDPECGGAK